MKRLLLIDQLDGTVPSKNFSVSFFKELYLIYKDCFSKGVFQNHSKIEWSLNVTREQILEFVDKHDWPQKKFEEHFALYSQDKCFQRYCMVLHDYMQKENKQHFIVSSKLKEELSKISLDISMGCIPSDYCAYFEVNNFYDDDGERILCAFSCVTTVGDEKAFFMLFITESLSPYGNYYSIRSMHMPYLPKRKIESVYKEYVVSKEAKDAAEKDSVPFVINSFEPTINYSDAFRTMLNLVLYSINPSEDVFEEIFEFSNKKRKREIQLKNITQKPCIKLGFKESQFLRLVTTNSVEVGSYWREQPYGPEKSLRRPQLISGYVKNIKRYEGMDS